MAVFKTEPTNAQALAALIFGLPYAGVCIPACIGGAVSVAALSQFSMGYFLFTVAGIWAIGHWYFSDLTVAKRQELKRPKVIKDEEGFALALRDYRRWNWGGILAMFLLTCGALWWTHTSKLTYERDQVSSHLEIKYEMGEGDVLRSTFTVKNNSGFAISDRHGISCLVNLIVGDGQQTIQGVMFAHVDNNWIVRGSFAPVPWAPTFPIRAHGDAQTDSCLSAFRLPDNGKIVCADLVVRFSYYLEDQPQMENAKKRLVFRTVSGGKLDWEEQPEESRQDFCYSYLSTEHKSLRDAYMLTQPRH